MSMTLLFIFIILLLLYCSSMVVLSDHPINSLLFLIGCFVNSSCLLILFGLDFLALIFIAIYVGAIAIFFLFIIMMMNIPSYYPKKTFFDEYSFLLLCILFFFLISFLIYDLTFFVSVTKLLGISDLLLAVNYINTIEVLGVLLYTHYCSIVVLSGMLLFFTLVVSVLLLEQTRLV